MIAAYTTGTLVGGALLALAFWYFTRDWLADASMLERKNYAGRDVPIAGGLPIIFATLVVLAVAIVVQLTGDVGSATADIVRFEIPVALLVAGFGMLGFVDDVLGDTSRGFRGHVRALASGRLTTGMFKLLGGAATAVVALGARGSSWGWVLLEAAIVALSANLANLLDRAPGRLLKASVVAGGVLVGIGWGFRSVAASAPALSAGWAMLPFDLREKMMLGDTGSNVVGASLGFLAVALSGRATQVWLLVGVVVLNLLSEVVSFSRIIDGIAPLRWLDRLGRPGV